MRTALIGYTGFVGSTLLRQREFDDCYRSTNIQAIKGMAYDLIVCAGAPAAKWKANLEPEQDLANLGLLMNSLQTTRAERFLLISTVDVYRSPVSVFEDTPVNAGNLEPYGRHRYLLEEFVRDHFARATVVRLPGLFGTGLKKNFIFDLIHSNALNLTHRDSVFQFYDMRNLWHDLLIARDAGLDLVNFATEPISAQDVARDCFGISFVNATEKPPVRYDMRTRFADRFGATGEYLYTRDYTVNALRRFILEEKEREPR